MLFKQFFPMLAPIALASAQGGNYFNDTAPDRMLLGNPYYELALSKTNGGVLALLDKAGGSTVTLGSRGGCLWGALYGYPGTSQSYVGGCSYSAGGANRFSYAWNPASQVLTLRYAHDPTAPGLDGTVTVKGSSRAFLDLSLSLQNYGNALLGNTIFPSDLLFSANSVQAGYLPFRLPGVRLQPAWFQSGATFFPIYPGGENFADYLALDVSNGHLAFYSINPKGPIAPVKSGFLHYPGDAPDQYVFYHEYQTSVPAAGTYTSPTVRVWVGAVPKDTILAYRSDNAVADYHSIAWKLGAAFGKLAQSPLVKLDLAENNQTFQALAQQLVHVPKDVLIHPAAYMQGGHDHSYPDFLPPDSRWGTTTDFRAFVDIAHYYGQLVMPYMNPTWWLVDSPTLKNLPSPLTPASIAVIDVNGQPVEESYGCTVVDGHQVCQTGIVVSPWHPFVQQRLAEVMAQWRADVPVDLVFEDQVGSRQWLQDFNPSEPTPLSYSDGWLSWWKTYSAQKEMTEDGWDRLAEDGIGFCGSPLTGATSFNIAQQRYGIGSNGNTQLVGIGQIVSGYWDPYPLATWLLHDKVFLYQHDLDEGVTTDADEVITWDLAFGDMLYYLWQRLNTPRGNLGSALQNAVGPYHAGQTLDNFTYLAPLVTASSFGALTVIANWQTSAYTIDGDGILPGGYLARTSDGVLVAGSFTGTLNGVALSQGEHHIIIQLISGKLVVRQPVGADTDVAVPLPSGWVASDSFKATAYDNKGIAIGTTPVPVVGSNITFHYAAQIGQTAVDHYEIVDTTLVGLPVISSVVNAADFRVEPLSPGAWFSIFGQNLGSAGQWTSADTFTLGGASVSVCGVPAQISYNSGPVNSDGNTYWQINALMPNGVAGQTSCAVVVSVGANDSRPATVTIAPGVMELFQFTSAVGTLPIVTHADYSLIGPASAGLIPAQPGEIVVAWGTGDCAAPLITLGGLSAGLVFSGRTGPGLCQINFTLPGGLTGANPLAISTSRVSNTLWTAP